MGHDGSRSESPWNSLRTYRPIDGAGVTKDTRCGLAELQTVIAAAMSGCVKPAGPTTYRRNNLTYASTWKRDMSNDIFDALLQEKIRVFKSAFSTLATEVFLDPEAGRLRHSGEYGMYRENIVKDFLKFLIPRSLDLSTGFLITSMNDVSTQCDVVVFDPHMTPLFQEGDRHRFFPVETVFCVAEVKSTVSRAEFAKALNKLARTKALSERISHPRVLAKHSLTGFDPLHDPHDLIPTVLICQKLDFKLDGLALFIDELYESKVEQRHKHNMVLSIEDGLLTYIDQLGRDSPYPEVRGERQLVRFQWPDTNPINHFKSFAASMFMLAVNKTLLYPELSFYMGTVEGGKKQDQVWLTKP